ncbi:helicase protein, partial [Cooperia oncophora]
MSRMLDVLQAFLSYHGYQYFRLDGTTGIEQRQAMMERFNADSKIFCFILSTRSGGVGVNLTGADTVIFYDSDWNPTMDAQAQDRCHRIGQTRNVTIFRLISERTIEENILRKANQKRRLGEMAIDDAGFTPEFFKQSDNIRDLFDGDVEVGDIDIGERPKSQRDVEKAMAALEDEQDVNAAKMVLAETKADIAEFDETRHVGATESSLGGFFSCLDSEDPLDEKYIELIIEADWRYIADELPEAEYKPEFEEEVREAEAVIEQKREDWVRAHNKALSNGDANDGIDENSVRLDDDFYGNGMLLDEQAPQLKSSSPPRKTLSGRRIIAPNSVTTSLSPSHILRSTCAPTTKRSAAQTAARSAVRKATARVSARRNQQTKTEPGKASPPPSSSPSPINHETKKRRGRPPRKSLVSGDTASQEPPAPSAEMTPKQEPPKSPVPIKQEAVKPKSPPAVFAFHHDFLDGIMPMWTPFPTPPLSDTDNDIYFDECLDLLYDRDFMTEDKLPSEIHELPKCLEQAYQPTPPPAPPPHNTQQSSSDAAVMSLLILYPNPARPLITHHHLLPTALHPIHQLNSINVAAENRVSKKERRALPRQLEQKGRELMRPVTPPPAVREEYDYEGPEWNIIEDQALLTAVRNEEIMCHSFERMKTSLRYNWEYISVHLRKGRVSTDLQYAHDADKLRESSVLGRLRLIESLTEKQNAFKCARRPIEHRSLEPSGRLPPAQESRLASMNIRFPTGLAPQEILSNLEEKRIAQEAAKKKLAEQQANNERPNSPPHPVISVCVRPPAVTAGNEIVQSRMPIVISVPQLVLPSPPALQQSMAQDLSMNVMPQSHSPVGGMRRTASHPSTAVALGSGLQHVQGSGASTQHNYVVVSQDSIPPSSRMQFVTRAADGMTIGQSAQPVYRSISNTSQTKRTPPNTPSLNRVQGSYMTNVQTVSGNSQLFQPGATTVSGAPRGRVMQRPAAPRMFVQQAPQSGDRSYVVPQQQIRMVSTQRLPPPKRTIGQKAPMTAVMVPSRAGQPHQLRAVPRGFTQGTRIMNVVMAPSSVASSSSSQSLPIQSTSQPGGGTIMASAP